MLSLESIRVLGRAMESIACTWVAWKYVDGIINEPIDYMRTNLHIVLDVLNTYYGLYRVWVILLNGD